MVSRRTILIRGAALAAGAATSKQTSSRIITDKMMGLTAASPAIAVAPRLEAGIAAAAKARAIVCITQALKIDRSIAVADHARIDFSPNGRIDNIADRSALPQQRSIFRVGNYHPFHYMRRREGSQEQFRSMMDRRRLAVAPKLGDTRLKLLHAADVSGFIPGQIYALHSAEFGLMSVNGFESQYPTWNILVKIVQVEVVTKSLILERPLPVDFDSPPFLCSPLFQASDHGSLIGFAQDVVITNANGSGYCIIAHTNACYGQEIGDWKGDWNWAISANGLSHARIGAFRGTFSEGFAELKWCCNDCVWAGASVAICDTDGAKAEMPMVSLGERARGIELRNFQIEAPNWRANSAAIGLIELRAVDHCKIENFVIDAPKATGQAITVAAEPSLRPSHSVEIRRARVQHASAHDIVVGDFASKWGPPTEVLIEDGIFRTTYSSDPSAVSLSIFGKSDAIIRYVDTAHGAIWIDNGSVIECVVGSPIVRGRHAALIGRNWISRAGMRQAFGGSLDR